MPDKITDLLNTLALFCPEDSTKLEREADALLCPMCKRHYPIHDGELIELLPRAPTIDPSFSAGYAADYAEEFNRPFQWDKNAMAWGAPEKRTPRWVARRNRQVRWALPLLSRGQTAPSIFCDLSGGAGYYTLEYAKHFQRIVHCDLSIGSLNYVHFKSKSLGINNIVFLRIDYFRPPFNHNIPLMMCCDTLIRGPAHERMLLQSIRKSLAPDGTALIDFHNWWHNPIRRMKLLKQNFPTHGSYTRSPLENMLREAGLEAEFFPFFQEFEQRGIAGKISSKILPPTRLGYRCRTGSNG